MKKQIFRLLWLQFSVLLAAWGQSTPISSIRIFTVPDGARFYVDGQIYYAAQTFLWPQGSKHIIQFPTKQVDGVSTGYQQSQDEQVRYTFGGWADDRGLLAPASSQNQTITADPSITFIRANLSVTYRVSLRFSNSPTGTQPECGSPGNAPQDAIRSGIVFFGGVCYGSDIDTYLGAGVQTANAIPYPGWVFTGWYVNGQKYPAYLTSLNIPGPVTIRPVFEQGKRIQFVTEPFGMQLLVDRTPTPTSAYHVIDSHIFEPGNNTLPCQPTTNLPPFAPATLRPLCLGEFDFIPGSQHTIAAVTPQLDRSGNPWVFDKFTNGMAQNSVIVAGTNTSTKDVITAKFVQGVQVAFLTNPPGLKVQVDGTEKWQNYNFIWATGSTHTVTAPASQVDSSGRRWTFQGWSNGGAATQTLTADIGKPNQRYMATYTALGQVRVQTNPPGITLKIDGTDCSTPCTIDRDSGTQVTIAAPDSLPQDADSRLDFAGWGDGGGSTRVFTFGSDAKSIFANYTTSYRVAVAADPANGVELTFDPPSGDLFYPGDSVVTVSAKAKPGYKFRRWGGDLSGVFPVNQLAVSGPRSVIAMLDRVPYIAPAGIKNAAGETVDGSVAPGSIIAIVGESLAPKHEIGPTNPLAQAIAGTVVTVNDRFLPLLFVSPQQINAQILSDLPDGDYTLKVQTTGQATITANFTISRNAPGLFTRPADGQPFGMASHEDGSPITPESPARRGETVSIFGTGFGPYDQKVIDGFLIPDPSNYRLLDPVEISAGELPVQAVWSGAAPGLVGTTLTKFKVDESLPGQTNVEITVKVNGKPSNKVLLPVE